MAKTKVTTRIVENNSDLIFDKLTLHHRQSHIGDRLAGILLIHWRGRRVPCIQLYYTRLSVLLGNCARSVLIPFSSTIGAWWLNLRKERQNIFVRSYSYIILAVLAVLTKNLTTGSGPGCMGFFSFGEKNLCKCHVMIDSRGADDFLKNRLTILKIGLFLPMWFKLRHVVLIVFINKIKRRPTRVNIAWLYIRSCGRFRSYQKY